MNVQNTYINGLVIWNGTWVDRIVKIVAFWPQIWNHWRRFSPRQASQVLRFQTITHDRMCLDYIWGTWRVSYKRQKLFTLRKHKGSAPVFGRVSVPYLFSFQCFVFLRFVTCMPNVTSVSGLFVLYCPFGFRWRFFNRLVRYNCPVKSDGHDRRDELRSDDKYKPTNPTGMIIVILWPFLVYK